MLKTMPWNRSAIFALSIYYFLNLPADFLPWTVLLPGALIFYYPWAERLKNPASLALTCWFAAIFVFFTVSKSKITYLFLPVSAVRRPAGFQLSKGVGVARKVEQRSLALYGGVVIFSRRYSFPLAESRFPL